MQTHPTRRETLKLTGAFIASAALLSACGNKAVQAEDTGPVTLRFYWWGGDARHKATQDVIDAFHKDNPNITVTGEFSPWGGYWDKLATQVAAKDAPDIIQMDEAYIREYSDRGSLLDIKALQGIDTSSIDAQILDTGSMNGKMFGLPVGIAAPTIMANPWLLQQAGVAMPDDMTWSWDDYRRISQQVSQKLPGVAGLMPAFGDIAINLWARQHGDRLYDDDANVVIKPDTLVSFWNDLLEMVSSGAAPQPSTIIESYAATPAQGLLGTNKVAFERQWHTQLGLYSTAAGHDLKMLRLPGESQGPRGTYFKPSMYWSVSSRTKHPQSAAKFLNYLANSQTAGDLLMTERGIPANTKIRAGIAGKLSATDRAVIDYTNQIQNEVRPAPPVTPAGGGGSDELASRYASDILFKRQTPEQAAPAFISELKSMIQK